MLPDSRAAPPNYMIQSTLQVTADILEMLI